jgi:hypothetical protein
MLDNIVQAFLALKFEYLEQFAVALLPMSLTVVIHGLGIKVAGRYFKRFGAPAGKARRGSNTVVLVVIVAMMLATHFVEVGAWAVFFFATGMLPNPQDAMIFSVNSYTTLGASNIELAGRWRGFGGFEAMTAMLMFGWSTAVLALVVQKTHGIDG